MQGDKFEICKLLIEHGADVNTCGYSNLKPLLIALQNASLNMDMIKLFVEHGADTDIKYLLK